MRSAPPAPGARRTGSSALRRYRATARRRSGTGAVGLRRPPPTRSTWPARPGTGPEQALSADRTRCAGHRAAGLAAGRCGRASTRTVGGGRYRQAPSRIRSRLRCRCANRQHDRARSPTERSCLRRPPRAIPQRGYDPHARRRSPCSGIRIRHVVPSNLTVRWSTGRPYTSVARGVRRSIGRFPPRVRAGGHA